MFLIEKDQFINTNNLTNVTRHFLDQDRHKFETFADALWWGIVSSFFVKFPEKKNIN